MVVAEKLQVRGFHCPFPELGDIIEGGGYRATPASCSPAILLSCQVPCKIPLPNPLTRNGRGLIAALMIKPATILVYRRRRIIAVWADTRV
jgi:hypothetical protein